LSRFAFNLLGRQFGRLTVIEERPSVDGVKFWLCRCTCGKTKLVRAGSLLHQGTQSCGCLQFEARANNYASGYKKKTHPCGPRITTLDLEVLRLLITSGSKGLKIAEIVANSPLRLTRSYLYRVLKKCETLGLVTSINSRYCITEKGIAKYKIESNV